MKHIRFIAQANPLRAILEAYSLAALAILTLLALRNELAPVNIDQGWFFTSAGVAVWTALRLRVPMGRCYRRGLIEIVTGLIASAPVLVYGALIRDITVLDTVPDAFFSETAQTGDNWKPSLAALRCRYLTCCSR